MTSSLLEQPQTAAIRSLLIDEVHRTVHPAPARGTTVRNIRRVGFGTLAVGAVATVLVVASVTLPRTATPADASELLRDAAAQTITSSDPVVGPGQYLKVSTSAAYLALTSDGPTGDYIGYVDRQQDDAYYTTDSTGPVRSSSIHFKPTTFYGDGAEAFADKEWNSYLASDGAPTPQNGELGGSGPAPEDLATLPRDPEALLAYLRGYHFEAGTSDANVFDHVVTLLRDGRVPADLRGTLYQALALVPAVSIVGQQAVGDGRSGTAFGLAATNTSARQEIIIDTSTGQYLGERQVAKVAFGAIPAGTPMQWTAVTVSVVDTVP